MDDTHRNEFDDLVRRAKGYHVHPLTPGEKAGVLWADAVVKKAGNIGAMATIIEDAAVVGGVSWKGVARAVRAYLLEGGKG